MLNSMLSTGFHCKWTWFYALLNNVYFYINPMWSVVLLESINNFTVNFLVLELQAIYPASFSLFWALFSKPQFILTYLTLPSTLFSWISIF